MEVALQQKPDKIHCHAQQYVSILVIMEVALQQLEQARQNAINRGFNPCYNGSCIATQFLDLRERVCASFNPCYNGSCIATSNQALLLLYIG